MADRHAFGLQRLAELSGLLVEQAYKRAIRADEPEEKDRAALVFDRLARGYRLTVALEARMARDLRREARAVIELETGAKPSRRADGPRPERAAIPCEIDHEDEADLEISDPSLGLRLKDITHLLEARADLLDPDGHQRAALAEVAAWWAVGQPQKLSAQTTGAQTSAAQTPAAKPARRPRSAGTSRAWPVRSTETAPDPSPQAAWRGSG